MRAPPRAWDIALDMPAGVSAPFGYFDPAGLGKKVTEKRAKYFRECELKHGRVAMLAAFGFPVAEHFQPLFGGNIDVPSCVEIKILRHVLLNHRVVLHAIDATPARWRGDAGSSPLDRARSAASSPRNDLVKNCRVHPTHWLISAQVPSYVRVGAGVEEPRVVAEDRDGLVQELR